MLSMVKIEFDLCSRPLRYLNLNKLSSKVAGPSEAIFCMKPAWDMKLKIYTSAAYVTWPRLLKGIYHNVGIMLILKKINK